MSISKILQKEIEKSNGKARIVKVPDDRRMTAQSLVELEQEIATQIRANEMMRNESIINATKQ